VGFVTVPSTSGVTAWSLVATQSEERRGRAYDVDSPGLRDGPVVLSDLVLGVENEGLSWNLHSVDIPLAPTGAVNRKVPVSLYYQVKAAAARADLQTTVALFRMTDGVAADTAALQVAFEQAVREGINEVAPTVDLSRLDKGAYRLDVRISDARGAVLSRRSVVIDLE
jgi:hypothetical protein